MQPGVRITATGPGTYNIESDFPGAHSTLKVLEDTIAAIKQAAVEAEMKGAGTGIMPADAGLLEKLKARGVNGG